MEKAYEPKKYEDGIYKKWEDSGLFNPDVCVEKGVISADADSYTIVLPPPNVTGTLHMGHAAMLAIEDVMIRYARMSGKKTLWIPGTDHAAVATESKVEGLLIKEEGYSKPKEALGKEAFMERVHQFAQDSHDTIVGQAKKMGASLDWSREAFTLDEVRNKSVRMVFKKMYDDGLIYRGYRVVNWSVKGQSTCSDDELVHVERPAKLYTFKYSKDFPITIATTRPETKLGDTAVAVHPEGKWKQYIGQTFTVENFGQPGHTLTIKVFGDEHVDDDFGTGALGVTTAHSPIDFEMYTKQKALGNDIGLIQVIGEDGNMTANAGDAYAGLSVTDAREKVVDWLRSEGLLEAEEDIMQNVGTSDRFKDVVEPLPKTQWFIDVNKKFVLPHSEIDGMAAGTEVSLKEIMQHVVRNKNITILPDRFEKTYFSWIDNLRDWCISRQIWYGHQIPSYYDLSSDKNKAILYINVSNKDLIDKFSSLVEEYSFDLSIPEYTVDGQNYSRGEEGLLKVSSNVLSRMVHDSIIDWNFVKENVSYISGLEKCEPIILINEKEALESYIQDPDTLDTWFSSGLWTVSTLLDSDMKEAESWEDWLTRSADFQTFHPTQVLETGYDIIFFWVARMILMTTYATGQIPFETVYLHGLVRDEKGRKMSKSLGNIINPLDMIDKFGTDATRLSLLIGNTPGTDMKLSEEKVEGLRNFANKLWNISRFMLMNIDNPKIDCDVPDQQLSAIDQSILSSLDSVVRSCHDGFKNSHFSAVAEILRNFTWNTLGNEYVEYAKFEENKEQLFNYILNTILKLWHPFMPFVTEAIWQEMYGESACLMVEKYPASQDIEYSEMDRFIDYNLKELISNIWSVRSEKKIPPVNKIDVYLSDARFKEFEHIVSNLGRLENIYYELPKESTTSMVKIMPAGMDVVLDLAGAIDIDAEKARLQKEIDTVAPYVASMEKKLAGPFASNAPEAVVAGEKKKLEDAKTKLASLQEQLAAL